MHPNKMLLCSDSLLPALRTKMRQVTHDSSRHLLCPFCRKRTKLYTLSDGRKKCALCQKKFFTFKHSTKKAIRRLSDILLCFCMDLPAQRATPFIHARYSTIADTYMHIRKNLAECTLSPLSIPLLTTTETSCRRFDSAFCRRCRRASACKGRTKGDAPVFGMKIAQEILHIDPLPDDAVTVLQEGIPFFPTHDPFLFASYDGFLCKGRLHRFTDRLKEKKNPIEHCWAWVQERLKRYHGIRSCHLGLYLKELEWKYNHRRERVEDQVKALIDTLPHTFFEKWSKRH